MLKISPAPHHAAAGRLAALGADAGFHHGLLSVTTFCHSGIGSVTVMIMPPPDRFR